MNKSKNHIDVRYENGVYNLCNEVKLFKAERFRFALK